MSSLKERALAYYEHYEKQIDLVAFVGGFVFDAFMVGDIDEPKAVVQQVVYLILIGVLLYYDLLDKQGALNVSERMKNIWNYRQAAVHFLLGTLLNIYSLLFLKSASFFSGIAFVVILGLLVVTNESKSVRKSKVDLKFGLYLICVFAFFSIFYPLMLGSVGPIPFGLALVSMFGFLWYIVMIAASRGVARSVLFRHFYLPGIVVGGLLGGLYYLRLIPPVPISAQHLGIYHEITKDDGRFMLSHENPWWRVWHSGDQEFKAEPNDKINIFAKIYSPARFSDTVIVHLLYKDPRAGWQTTDRIPMKIAGGRRGGYRGVAVKQNYAEGEWRVSLETQDSREIARRYFTVQKVAEPNPNRRFEIEPD